jgi:hypothetical protein
MLDITPDWRWRHQKCYYSITKSTFPDQGTISSGQSLPRQLAKNGRSRTLVALKADDLRQSGSNSIIRIKHLKLRALSDGRGILCCDGITQFKPQLLQRVAALVKSESRRASLISKTEMSSTLSLTRQVVRAMEVHTSTGTDGNERNLIEPKCNRRFIAHFNFALLVEYETSNSVNGEHSRPRSTRLSARLLYALSRRATSAGSSHFTIIPRDKSSARPSKTSVMVSSVLRW